MDTHEESLLLRVLGGKNPTLKILDFMIGNLAFDHSKTEIAEGAKISRTTLFTAWGSLEEYEIVSLTREVGRAKMFKLNMNNPVVKKLIDLDWAITRYYAPQSYDPPTTEEIPENIPHLPVSAV